MLLSSLPVNPVHRDLVQKFVGLLLLLKHISEVRSFLSQLLEPSTQSVP